MLADDHAVVRMGFRLLLEDTEDICVVAEAGSGEDACRQYDAHRPDVLVLDIAMPGIGGIEAITRIKARHPGAIILVLSAHQDTVHPRQAMAAGAAGYLCKRSPPEEVIEAIRQVLRGRPYLDAQIAHDLAVSQVTGRVNPVDALSRREFEVFLRLAQGRVVNDIASDLSLSPSTVGTHMYNIKQKLGASNGAEMAMIAVRNGLIQVAAGA
jgi:two-component system invasion response regulator UvrY